MITSLIICSLFYLTVAINAENIVMTEVFIIRVEPDMFNWTYEGTFLTLSKV